MYLHDILQSIFETLKKNMRALNFVLFILTIKLCSIQAIVTEDTGNVHKCVLQSILN